MFTSPVDSFEIRARPGRAGGNAGENDEEQRRRGIEGGRSDGDRRNGHRSRNGKEKEGRAASVLTMERAPRVEVIFGARRFERRRVSVARREGFRDGWQNDGPSNGRRQRSVNH